MRILLLFDHYPPYVGGAETLNQRIAEYLALRHRVDLLTRASAGAPAGCTKRNGVRIRRLPAVPRLLHTATACVAGMACARCCDLILCATYASGPAGSWLARRYGKPVVLMPYEILGDVWRLFKPATGWLYRCYERYVTSRPYDRFLAISCYTKARVCATAVSPDRVTVLHPGIDTDLFVPRAADPALRAKLAGDAPFVYGYFGRPGGSKGLRFLLEAVPAVAAAVPGSRLVLLLGPEPRDEFRRIMRLARRPDIAPHVRLHPPVARDDLPACLACWDAAVVPSLSEGFGFSAAELCAMQVPVVVTREGSLPEVVSGRVVRVARADSAALARGIIAAAQGRWETLPPRQFSWQDFYDGLDRMIEDVCALKRSGAV